MKRGIIIGDKMCRPNQDQTLGNVITTEELVRYTLYWDEIIRMSMGRNGGSVMEHDTPEVALLEKEGALKKVVFDISTLHGLSIPAPVKSGMGIFGLSENQYKYIVPIAKKSLAKQLYADNLMDCDTEYMGYEEDLLQAERESYIEINLENSLPLPSPNTSIEDVLMFKDTNQSEFLAFRNNLDELTLEIKNSNEIPRSKTVILNRLESSINDLKRISAEKWTDRWSFNYKTSFDLGKSIEKAGKFAASCAVLGGASTFTLTGGTIGAAAGAALGLLDCIFKVEYKNGADPKNVEPHNRYLLKLLQELEPS